MDVHAVAIIFDRHQYRGGETFRGVVQSFPAIKIIQAVPGSNGSAIV
jgi:hypothetical protein